MRLPLTYTLVPMDAAAKLFEGIALLIELAQRGEIDPWDVQVIEVIDRYLGAFMPIQEAAQATCEADLSQSGQAFLSASMLVLFKANTLLEPESPAAEPDPEDILPEAEDKADKLRLPLENQLRRRPATLPPQKRRVTLQELIDQLQLMATQLQLAHEADVSTKTTRNRLHSQSRAQAARAIAQLAHQENLTEVAGELEQFLNPHSHRILGLEQDWLNMDQLVNLWTQTKHPTPQGNQSQASHHGLAHPQPHERVSVFWALLLLSAQSKVELSQEEFYQEIKIRRLEVNSGVASEETV